MLARNNHTPPLRISIKRWSDSTLSSRISFLHFWMNSSIFLFNSSWLSDSSFLRYGIGVFLNDDLASTQVLDFLISLSLSLGPKLLLQSTQGGISHVSLFLRCRVAGIPCSSRIAFHVVSRLSFCPGATAVLSNFTAVSPVMHFRRPWSITMEVFTCASSSPETSDKTSCTDE